MSIIQQIRDKAAVLMIILIALSLIGFLVQDAFIGRSSGLFSGGPSSTVGSINGKKIDAIDYNEKIRQAEEGYRSRGYQMNESMTQSLVEGIWNGYIQEELIKTETDKLGMSFTPKELSSILFTQDAPQEFKQLFTDPNTGVYNIDAARNWFNGLKKSKQVDQLKMVNEQLINPLVLRQVTEKYTSIFSNGAYIPRWLVEKTNNDNSTYAGISYVGIPYNTINDSIAAVKVTDAEINEYVAKHKDEYKQQPSRSIAYVVFDAKPVASDSAALFNQLESLRNELLQATDAKAFVTRNSTATPFFDGYVLKSKLQMAMKDSIISLPVGAVFGPYLDATNYTLAKKIEVRSIPDSVKCRHILIGTVDPRSGQVKRDDSTAKRLADSLFNVIKGGADLGTLALQFSEDEGSKMKGGEYDFTSDNFGSLAKEFAEFIFYKKAGDREIVKTQFGYHIIEVISQKKFEEAYKVAYLSKQILASPETDNTASTAATQFSANSRNLKAFEENVTKMNYNKRIADNVGEMDYAVAGMSSRSFVKWIYDNKPGTVSEPFDLNDKYVVAVVTGVVDEGVQPASIARLTVEPILRNKKKAAEIIKKMGTANTLEAIASSAGQQVQRADTVRFGDAFIPNLGNETKVIGAAFNKENQSKLSAPIEGQSGVFVIKVNNVGALPNLSGDVDQQRKGIQLQMKQFAPYATTEALRKSATIKDTRRKAGF
jgi:peptidyl-prolyl cis-trans isomerase D